MPVTIKELNERKVRPESKNGSSHSPGSLAGHRSILPRGLRSESRVILPSLRKRVSPYQ